MRAAGRRAFGQLGDSFADLRGTSFHATGFSRALARSLANALERRNRIGRCAAVPVQKDGVGAWPEDGDRFGATFLERDKTGGSLEQDDGLGEFVESGRILDSKVSPELLETIFMNGSPLHDGAVIINGDRILAAACLLPLSQNPHVSLSLGTRHRAAIGMSEDSDALVLVVSEESGAISLARGGVLSRGLEPAEVLSTLRKLPG